MLQWPVKLAAGMSSLSQETWSREWGRIERWRVISRSRCSVGKPAWLNRSVFACIHNQNNRSEEHHDNGRHGTMGRILLRCIVPRKTQDPAFESCMAHTEGRT